MNLQEPELEAVTMTASGFEDKSDDYTIINIVVVFAM